jgi:hypothetical protein
LRRLKRLLHYGRRRFGRSRSGCVRCSSKIVLRRMQACFWKVCLAMSNARPVGCAQRQPAIRQAQLIGPEIAAHRQRNKRTLRQGPRPHCSEPAAVAARALRDGRPRSFHTAGADLKPVGLARRVLLPSPGAAICWLSLSGPCFRDATGSTDRENRAAHRCSHLL